MCKIKLIPQLGTPRHRPASASPSSRTDAGIRDRQARQVSADDSRRFTRAPGGNFPPLRTDQCPIRTQILAHHRHPTLRRMQPRLPGHGKDAHAHYLRQTRGCALGTSKPRICTI